jgi:5'-methylthioadenosine phosphorylase
MNVIGIIGGSGLDDPSLLSHSKNVVVETPYGEPSSPLRCGQLKERDVVFLSRHGKQHTIPPSKINNRANVYALKKLGCTHILATAACGSLRSRLGRGQVVLPDQFIDFTRHRAVSYYETFEPGIENAMHTPMADPFDKATRQCLLEAGKKLDISIYDGGVILTIEGPRFSTRAESHMFRKWGADLVNMTVSPEAILANELSIAYTAIAIVTDFDCWKDDEPPLRVEDLVKIFHDNVDKITRLILGALPTL